MIDLDHQLLYQAQCFMDGSNNHHLRELIFAYEQAISLHNAGWGRNTTYNRGPELQLRSFILQHRLHELDRQLTASRNFAATLSVEINKMKYRVQLVDRFLCRS